MSLSIIKYPQLVKDGYTSRWNCAHLPIVYEIQRQDYVITYTEALLNVVKISLNGAVDFVAGDTIYVEIPTFKGNLTVYSVFTGAYSVII